MASLANSRFAGAMVKAADFTTASLLGARDLAPHQLSMARTAAGTTLPNGSAGPFMKGSGAERAKMR